MNYLRPTVILLLAALLVFSSVIPSTAHAQPGGDFPQAR